MIKPIQKPVFKTCNVHARGCQKKWNMTERAATENVKQRRLDGLLPYISRYDACNNPLCQRTT